MKKREMASEIVIYVVVGICVLLLWYFLGSARFGEISKWLGGIAAAAILFVLWRLGRIFKRVENESAESQQQVAIARRRLLDLAEDKPPYHKHMDLKEVLSVCSAAEIERMVLFLKEQKPGQRSLRKAIERFESEGE